MIEADSLLTMPPYDLVKADKQTWLGTIMNQLCHFHAENSPHYRRLTQTLDVLNPQFAFPPIHVRLFKEFELKSIADDAVAKCLQSSGTTGAPSKIFLDKENARLQSQILVRILQHWLGKSRRPMLLIDSPDTIKQGQAMTARAAGLQGLSIFGFDHTYALDANMKLDEQNVVDFFTRHQGQSVLIFGFTFMVWQCFLQQLEARKLSFDLPQSVLIHGGGWKKLQQQAVSPVEFKQRLRAQLGQLRIHDYYGMVEQTGTIYMECDAGHFHCPVWSDITIRDPDSLAICDKHQQGLIQLDSVLARSYPGQSILTEDLGVLLGEDDCSCGRHGKYFNVLGRVPQAETRGCSDTFI